jgi:hypothetical protein
MTPKILITDEMQRAFDETRGGPVYVMDADGRVTHVVISADVYQHLQGLIGEQEFDVRDSYLAQERALAAAWDDPALDIYNDYDAQRRST